MDSSLERLRREIKGAIEIAQNSHGTSLPADKWTTGQILEHLFLTYRHTNRALAKCLESGAPLATSSTIKQRLGTMLVVNFGYFPEGRKSPERAVPKGMPPEEVQATILDEIQKMESGLNDCERRFGRGTKIIDHPILGALTARQWRKFHWVHGRHHTRQIQKRASG